MIKFVLTEGIKKRDENRKMIRVKGGGGEVTGGSGSGNGPEDCGREVRRDEGDIGGGGLRVRGEAGGKGRVKDGEVSVKKGVSKRVTTRIRQRRTPRRIMGI